MAIFRQPEIPPLVLAFYLTRKDNTITIEKTVLTRDRATMSYNLKEVQDKIPDFLSWIFQSQPKPYEGPFMILGYVRYSESGGFDQLVAIKVENLNCGCEWIIKYSAELAEDLYRTHGVEEMQLIVNEVLSTIA